MRRINLLFVMLLSMMGVTQVCADTADFENALPEGWEAVGTMTYYERPKTGSFSIGNSVGSGWDTNRGNYIKTTVLEGNITFWIRSYKSNTTGYVVLFKLNDDGTVGDKLQAFSTSNTTFAEKSYTLDAPTALAIVINYAHIDNMTYTEASAAEGAVLSVTNYESGSTFDFGVVPAGETKTFTLRNLGADELTISSVAVSGDFEITSGSDITSIASMGSADVTVATPDADASGALTIVSNDENSPYVINLTSTYKVPAPIIALDPTEVSFGKVSENASQVITVSNSGEAELIGTITSDNTDFTVSPSEINVPVGETAEFTVTFNYDVEAYGAHTATITVTPTVGEAATLAVSAKVANPNVWSEDFKGEGLPNGWEAGSNWTFANGVARATYGSSSTGYKYFLTTPTLEVAEGESMEFQYRGTANYTDIRIQISKDGGDFEAYKTISVDKMTDFETYVIEGLEPGQYQFRFANDNYELDNFEGFKLATLEHDMTIKASDIPSRGDTASEYIASVTVQENAGKDETVTAKLYIDGNVVATAEQEVAANEEATIELSFEPTEVVLFKKAYIEITYAEGLTKKTDEVSVYIQEVTVKVLDEVAANEFNTGATELFDRVKLNYTVKQGWNTIAVPFIINNLSVFGENVQAYQFSDYADGELKFSRTTMIPAATPCVFYTDAPTTSQISFDNVTIYSYNASEEDCAVTKGEATFQGTYAPIAAPGMQGKYGVVPSTGKIQKGGAGASIKALRAYFILPENVEGSKLMMTFIEEDGDVTSIKGIENLNFENAEMFDLSGRKVIGQKKAGIYILNGKKVVVK